MKNEELVRFIEENTHIYIYGAGFSSGTICYFLKHKKLFDKILGFIVTNKKDDVYLDRNVYEIDEIDSKNALVLVATSEFHHEEIKKKLDELCFKNVIFITSSMVDNMVLELNPNILLLEELDYKKQSEKSLTVYMANGHFDKKNVEIDSLDKWIKPIQVGCNFTDKVLSDIRDNIGDNISYKNKNYCELTATYWLWKNCDEDYIGLCHYRRHFKLNENCIRFIKENEIDVVLPIPVISLPSAVKHHEWYIKSSDFDAMIEVLKTYYPDYYEESKRIFDEKLFYCHNIWIMKKECLNDYCKWLFDVLEKVDRIVNLEDNRQDRYIGYLAESLTTLYFRYNKDKLKIRHVGEKMIV